MRLDIYGQFVVNVVRPDGGWSKGRPIAFIEAPGVPCQADLLIPNDLSDRDLERYVAENSRPSPRLARRSAASMLRRPPMPHAHRRKCDEVAYDQAT